LKIMAASATVADYLGEEAQAFANALGELLPGAVVPARVQMAVLLMVAHLYREREGRWKHAAVQRCDDGCALLPGALALLYTLRKQVAA
ncbi:MAG: head-tail connector protein, partial [Pseudomonas aeruginosa]